MLCLAQRAILREMNATVCAAHHWGGRYFRRLGTGLRLGGLIRRLTNQITAAINAAHMSKRTMTTSLVIDDGAV
ncbi:hypothetical protein A3SK_0127760 [Pseudomonas amygdali pv. tabaci str. 6605]|nr:hypothetical protein A3SK_0127760 [Pseudomonas amygdali pv. tabaci str. 6605]